MFFGLAKRSLHRIFVNTAISLSITLVDFYAMHKALVCQMGAPRVALSAVGPAHYLPVVCADQARYVDDTEDDKCYEHNDAEDEPERNDVK